MGKCLYCERSGFFLKVSRNGLCRNCEPIVAAALQRPVQIIDESIDLVNRSKKLETRVSRCHDIIVQAQKLLEYDYRGIPTTDPPPQYFIDEFTKRLNTIIPEELGLEVDRTLARVEALKTPKAKANRIAKALQRIRSFRADVVPETLLDPLENRLYLVVEQQGLGELVEAKGTEQTAIRDARDLVPVVGLDLSIPKRTARLLYISDDDPANYQHGPSISIKLELTEQGLHMHRIPRADPSTIFTRLPIRRPSRPASIERPPYYPTYAELSPQQRWIYLNWLTDISQEINIGYVFIYYYGLERQLLMGEFDLAFDEILYLRRVHRHSSFLGYSSTALWAASIHRKRLDRLQQFYEETVLTNLDNTELLIAHKLRFDLSPDNLVALSKNVRDTNRRYIKNHPERYTAILAEVMTLKYGGPYLPFGTCYDLRDIPKSSRLLFANMSFPQEMRSTDLPDFFSYAPFVTEVSAAFAETHERLKAQLGEERRHKRRAGKKVV